MLYKNVRSIYLLAICLCFLGCTGGPSLPNVSETELNMYENGKMLEYEKEKQTLNQNKMINWVQAHNKKEPCKVFVASYDKDYIKKIISKEHKIYWDGECKSGYAYGIGREIEKGLLFDMESMAIYHKSGVEPEYLYLKDNLNDYTLEGDINNNNVLRTAITNIQSDIDINLQYASINSKTLVAYIVEYSPFVDNVIFSKKYPNFSYVFIDYTNNEFNDTLFEAFMANRENKPDGFGFTRYKNGNGIGFEASNGIITRYVQLPESFFKKMDSIFNEIKNNTQNIPNLLPKVTAAKKQYKDKICRSGVQVGFVDNSKYKAICNEEKDMANIITKANYKLDRIGQYKQQLRQQRNEQMLVNARMMEAAAAQRQASAAERQAYAAEEANRSYNTQMRQLNNNFMMYNLMPKVHDVYLHW